MTTRTEFPRPIREIEHTWLTLSDGCRLAARIWLPEDADADPVPAILEFLPYRKVDGTAIRDARRQPYVAGFGYATVRVDMRGTGESDGLITDEYTEQEHADCLEVMAWLRGQPWCDGNLGMWGISWGGFNALQLAALRPPGLKAIMTLMSTDDRYADDVHYRGGCVEALDMLHWASSMLVWNARPPDPRLFGDGWREAWLEPAGRCEQLDRALARASAARRLLEARLGLRGLLRDRRSRLRGRRLGRRLHERGAADAGRALRPRKGLIGPWAHAFPDDALPGPSIGFLQECVRWWDHWLKGIDTGIMDEPMLRAWMQDSAPPQTFYEVRKGRWVAEPEWPSPSIGTETLELGGGPHSILGVQTCGVEAGVWCAEGGSADLAGDQRVDDAVSLTWDFEPLAEPLEILGHPQAVLELEADRPQALVSVRLCDVAPDGSSLLVTRGVLNLTHRESHEEPEPLEPGRRYEITVPLDVSPTLSPPAIACASPYRRPTGPGRGPRRSR